MVPPQLRALEGERSSFFPATAVLELVGLQQLSSEDRGKDAFEHGNQKRQLMKASLWLFHQQEKVERGSEPEEFCSFLR